MCFHPYREGIVMKAFGVVVSVLALLAIAAPAVAATMARLEDVPVREVTIFKDGHAFVTHEGKLEVKDGAVVFEYLPEPVLGTFWAYARGQRVTLQSVVAGTDEIEEAKTAISLTELIRANAGKDVTLGVKVGDEVSSIEGTLVGIPEREVDRETATAVRSEYDYRVGRYVQTPATTRTESVTEHGDVVLVKTEDGLMALPISTVVGMTVEGDAGRTFTEKVDKRRLRLNISGGRGETTVGMTYLQKGLRWIPEYKVTISDDGTAVLVLQGTIINDMVDLDDVTVNLVVGVPTFAFKDQLSPLALKEAAAQLSQYFQPSSSTGYAFSNAIMSQSISVRGNAPGEAGGGPPEIAVETLGPQEDLFLYKVDHVSLKKGERMVVPVIEVKATYTDVYTWQIPFSPPPELLSNIGSQEREQLMLMARGSRVHHKLRLKNESEVPFTTGPALILKDGRLLAQSMIRYTSVGNEVDVDVTVATDIHAKKWEEQVARQDNARVIGNHNYTRLDMRGFLELTNYKKEPVTVEVTRAVLGSVTEASADGAVTQLNSFEDWSYLPDSDMDAWGGWYWRWWSSWPWWWHSVNDIGQIKWTVALKPGEKKQLQYDWYYYAY
jgi:hypothetical protein